MMSPIRLRPKDFINPHNILPFFRQKRGNGLLCTAGMLNGIFGEDENRHIAHWQSIKVVDHFEETFDDGTVTQRDRDRFTSRVSLVFADGRTTTLGDKGEVA